MTTLTGVMVTMLHVRKSGLCSKGTRAFMQKHGLDWQAFITTGIDSTIIRSTGDAMAIRVAEIAEGVHYGK